MAPPAPHAEIPGLYRLLPLRPLRHTAGVSFHCAPMEALPKVDAIDRVIHDHGAQSPGAVAGVERPWYMHPHQADNLIVLTGTRHVDLYTRRHGRIEAFVVEPDRVAMNGETLFDSPAMLVWPRGVFHRIRSGPEGSASVNFAVHYEGFDLRTNFNIYDLDPHSGDFKVLREGHLDQVDCP